MEEPMYPINMEHSIMQSIYSGIKAKYLTYTNLIAFKIINILLIRYHLRKSHKFHSYFYLPLKTTELIEMIILE